MLAAVALAACTSGRADEGAPQAASTPTSALSSGSSGPSGSSGTPADGGRTSRPPTSWVVTLGDSYVSGEGARFAGNTSGDRDAVDALGPTAYDDGREGEAQPGCHRAEVWPGQVAARDVGSINFACSGALTHSAPSLAGFKPGLDLHRGGSGAGQLVQLERFARRHHVTDLVVAIGGNDAGFGSIVASCLLAALDRRSQAVPCSEDQALAERLSSASLDAVADEIAASLRRAARSMASAGYHQSDYTVTVTTYPAPLPPAGLLRYDERQRLARVGGCPILDVDATWAARFVVPRINAAVRSGAQRSGLPNLAVLDLSRALVGHRLCEVGAARLEETRADSWRAPGVERRVEWVNEVSLDFTRTQGSLHPNYWGTQVLRDCVSKAIAGDDARSARCVVARDGSVRLAR